MRYIPWCVLPPVLLALNGHVAPEATARAAPRALSKPAPKLVAAEIKMADNSLIKVVLQAESLQVFTRYGKLSVPTRDIRRIEFGRRMPEGVAKRINAAVAGLGSGRFNEREAASAELLMRGEHAYPALVQAVRSKDKEVVKRVRTLLAQIRKKVPEARLNVRDHDVIVTPGFTIIGRIDGTSLRVNTAYFGERPLQLADLRSLRCVTEGGEGVKIKVDSAKYGLPQQIWLETDIEVDLEAELQITATGQVDLYPIGGEVGVYLSGPAGAPQLGRGAIGIRFGGLALAHSPGTLSGRIGKSGKEFVIGEKYHGTAKEQGKLHLRIAASPWGNAPSGEYAVQVTIDGSAR
jgi:hypothetical protein